MKNPNKFQFNSLNRDKLGLQQISADGSDCSHFNGNSDENEEIL